MADSVAKIVDLQVEIKQDIDELVDLKRDITQCIKTIGNTELQTLLELRYLCLKIWEQIAAVMDYKIRHIYRLHNDAVEN